MSISGVSSAAAQVAQAATAAQGKGSDNSTGVKKSTIDKVSPQLTPPTSGPQVSNSGGVNQVA